MHTGTQPEPADQSDVRTDGSEPDVRSDGRADGASRRGEPDGATASVRRNEPWFGRASATEPVQSGRSKPGATGYTEHAGPG